MILWVLQAWESPGSGSGSSGHRVTARPAASEHGEHAKPINQRLVVGATTT